MSSNALKDAIRICYDRLAPYYWSHTRPYAREQYLASFRSLRPGSRVIDVGCGTGHDAAFLAQLGLDVIAVDISPEMCRLARKRLAGIENVRVLEADSDHLAKLENTFDGVLSALEIFHHADLNETICKYARLLTLGGKLVIVTNHPVRNMLLRDPPNYFIEDFFWEDWGKHGKVPKFHWRLSTYISAVNNAGLRLEFLDEIPPSDDLVGTQDISITFAGEYPSLAVLGCSK